MAPTGPDPTRPDPIRPDLTHPFPVAPFPCIACIASRLQMRSWQASCGGGCGCCGTRARGPPWSWWSSAGAAWRGTRPGGRPFKRYAARRGVALRGVWRILYGAPSSGALLGVGIVCLGCFQTTTSETRYTVLMVACWCRRGLQVERQLVAMEAAVRAEDGSSSPTSSSCGATVAVAAGSGAGGGGVGVVSPPRARRSTDPGPGVVAAAGAQASARHPQQLSAHGQA